MSNAGLARAVVSAAAREGQHLGTSTLGSVFSVAAFAEPTLLALIVCGSAWSA